MTVPAHNPWRVVVAGHEGVIMDADSRIARVKESADLGWLRAAYSWRPTQIVVVQAIERRIRRLERDSFKGLLTLSWDTEAAGDRMRAVRGSCKTPWRSSWTEVLHDAASDNTQPPSGPAY